MDNRWCNIGDIARICSPIWGRQSSFFIFISINFENILILSYTYFLNCSKNLLNFVVVEKSSGIKESTRLLKVTFFVSRNISEGPTTFQSDQKLSNISKYFSVFDNLHECPETLRVFWKVSRCPETFQGVQKLS